MAIRSQFEGQELRKPDAQGRIIIGKEHSGETYAIEKQSNGDIILRPVVGIHKREAWLFANQLALNSVKQGLAEAANGQTTELGSFAQYTDESDEEQD
jgi:hypothetical protein